jgi:pimeloyl-ACP methyl ester carboxylesterase
MPEEKQFSFNKVQINYGKGPDNGPPLILLHGLSDRWQSYLKMIPLLSPYYTIYAPDLRGHGKSYRAKSYKIIDYSYDIEVFMDNFFDEPVLLVGHSLGAAVLMFIAAKKPGKCRGLGLIDPFIFADSIDDNGFRRYFVDCIDLCARYKSIDLIIKNIKERGVLAKKRATDLIQLDVKAVKTVLDGKVFGGFNLDGVLAGLNCPVVVLRGNPELDSLITEDRANYLKKRINNCTVEYLEKASHIIHIDRPSETASYILKFFASL